MVVEIVQQRISYTESSRTDTILPRLTEWWNYTATASGEDPACGKVLISAP